MKRSAPSTSHYARNLVIALLSVTLALGLLWRFTSLHQKISVDQLVVWGQEIRGHRWTPVVMILIFVLGGLLFFVHATLLWATAFAFDPIHAILYAEIGSLASALTTYGLGRILRQDVVDRIAGTQAHEVSRALGKRGMLTIIVLHVFPICPFSVLNLIAGSTHIGLMDFVGGTVIGSTPGILVVCLFGYRIAHAVFHPGWFDFIALPLFALIGWMVLRKYRRRILSDVTS